MIPDADAGESGEPRRWGLPDLLGVLNLERIDAGLYRSQAAGEPGHRLFGGQVAAQAQGSIFHRDGTLIATVVQEGIAHSSRPGESVRPIGEG